MKNIFSLFVILFFVSCATGDSKVKTLKTISNVTVGDKYDIYEGFNLNDNGYYQKVVTINEIEGVLNLYVFKGLIYAIEFEDSETWLGSTTASYQIFKYQEINYNDWIEGALKNYQISFDLGVNGENSFTYKTIGHKYSIEPIEIFGVRMGTSLKYKITDSSIAPEEKVLTY